MLLITKQSFFYKSYIIVRKYRSASVSLQNQIRKWHTVISPPPQFFLFKIVLLMIFEIEEFDFKISFNMSKSV